jgi:hypothetical protein
MKIEAEFEVSFATLITDPMRDTRQLPLSLVPLILNPAIVYLHTPITWRLLRNNLNLKPVKEYQDDNPATNRRKRQNNAVHYS